jgi:hypothetical protein
MSGMTLISPTAGTDPAILQSPNGTTASESLTRSTDDRKANLDRALKLRGEEGWRIESRSGFQATIAKGKRINNAFNLILTLVTAGLWAIVWIPRRRRDGGTARSVVIVAITGGIKRLMVTIDEYGNVVEQKL